ncbi:hypothetical protein G7Y89_g3556 [Cudoniella acicularis]|uniref:Uncharacterized protein n=1 Tax=Cudoniella acicularis TaxID=354080 RepID=A0A8H4RRY8_9HELO|nr:hypothetical protein G7Y89_g3556 [Cudoniella acicularis]
MSSLASNTVYMTLNSRGMPGTFHWGVFVTSSPPRGQYYHATNKFGGWQLEAKPSSNVLSSLSLVLVYRIGSLSSQAGRLDQVLRAVPANGSASLRTGEAFTCRIWAKDALMALHNSGIVTLSASIDKLEKQAFALARRLETKIESGEGKASVLDSDPSSSSSSSRRR